MAGLYYLSDQPSLPAPQLFPHQDKLIHAAAYAILAVLLLLAMPMKTSGFTSQQALVATLLASLYGITDEFHQSFVPGRDADLLDWMADTGGALISTLLLAWITRRMRARNT
jgi:VanZ family protein